MQVISKQPVTEVFEDSPSRHTREQYPKTLRKFFNYLRLPGKTVDEQGQAFLDKARAQSGFANDSIRQYILENRKRVDSEQITAGTLKGLFTPIKMFCDVYDDVTVSINWKRIKKIMPSPQQYADDRAYSLEEIKKILDYPDRRLKSIILIMVSSGMRVGGFEGLKFKHIREITDEETGKKVIAAHLYVTKNKGGRPYNTFISGECYNEVKKYMDWRKMWGEQVTGESYVIRDDFKTADTKRNSPPEHGGGLVRRAETPRQLKVPAINRLVVRALYEQGLRETLEDGQRRHDVRTCHGFRKYFFSRASLAGIHGLTLEILMGHKLPESIPSYMKPTPEDFKNAYLDVMPAVTIYQEQQQDVQTLKKQQESLEQKYKEEAAQKNKEMEELRAKVDILMSNFVSLMEHRTGAKESIDLIVMNGEAIDKSQNPQEEEKQQLFRAAAIARARNKARGKNLYVEMDAIVKEEAPPAPEEEETEEEEKKSNKSKQ